MELPVNAGFVGQMAGSWRDQACLAGGVPDATKIVLFLLSMPDKRFWGCGENVGNGWEKGKSLREK